MNKPSRNFRLYHWNAKFNDTEIDFTKLLMMKYHQGAINMANVELQSGKNDSLKRIAQKIITG